MMKQPNKKGPGRGGRRKGAGRKPSGKSQIKIRIRTQIIEHLQPGAAGKLAAIIEKKFEKTVPSKKHDA